VLHPQVERVGQQRLVVRPGVQHDGQHAVGRDPARRAVERELPDGDASAISPEVPEPEDAAAVRDDDDVDFARRPVVHPMGWRVHQQGKG